MSADQWWHQRGWGCGVGYGSRSWGTCCYPSWLTWHAMSALAIASFQVCVCVSLVASVCLLRPFAHRSLTHLLLHPWITTHRPVHWISCLFIHAFIHSLVHSACVHFACMHLCVMQVFALLFIHSCHMWASTKEPMHLSQCITNSILTQDAICCSS